MTRKKVISNSKYTSAGAISVAQTLLRPRPSDK